MKKYIKYIAGTIIPFIISSPVYATPPRIQEIASMIDNVFKYVMPIGGLVATLMIIYGGYMWIISGGDAQKTQQAQGTLTWAVLGLVFLFIFQMILKIVFNFLGN